MGLKYFSKYIRDYWKLCLLSVVCVSLEALFDLFQPKLMSTLVDQGVLKGDLQLVMRMGLTMLAVAAMSASFAITRSIVSAYTSQNIGYRLRNDLFEKIHQLSVDDADRFEGGSLITRMTNDITQIQNFVNMMLRVFFKAPVLCIGAIVMVGTLSTRAIFLIVPVIFCVFFIIGISMKLSYPRFLRMQQSLDKLNTTIREYLTGIRLVKAFRRFKDEAFRFGKANEALAQRSIAAARLIAIFGPCMQLFANMGIVGILFLGARWVFGGNMEVGGVMAFVIYMQIINQSFHVISNILNQLLRVNASWDRIVEVLSADVPIFGEDKDTVYDENAPMVAFHRVCFSYQDSTGQPALDDVSFSVRRGTTLGIIGATGSGKTSLSSLLLRFYTPTTGEIHIEGVPISGISEPDLRRRITIVPQTAMLFSGTVKENILWGKLNATEDEVRHAAELSCAHEFIIGWEDGYDTIIGQGGVNLSGGQKQRISIARALIRNPDVLVLDDCTSALDAITEAKVRQNLAQYASGMTCILITQRIGTAMSCESVLTLDHGRVVGFGSHDNLMQDCEQYRDIYRSQIGVFQTP